MTILVTGATGSVGRLLVDELTAAGAPVRALTNNPKKAALPAGVEVAKGYLGNPATLPAALAKIDTVYLAPLPAYVDDFVAAAKEAGVRRVVVLSGEPADYEAQGDPRDWHYYKIERAIEAAGGTARRELHRAEADYERPGRADASSAGRAHRGGDRAGGEVRGADT